MDVRLGSIRLWTNFSNYGFINLEKKMSKIWSRGYVHGWLTRRRCQDPCKHLRWRALQQQLTTFRWTTYRSNQLELLFKKLFWKTLQYLQENTFNRVLFTVKLPVHLAGNKAKGRISKQVFQENKDRQIFRKTNIFYPLIHVRVRIRG